MNNIDWIYIGSNGFAQLGDPLYHEKNLAEKAIIFQILEEKQELHIPDQFIGIASYIWKAQDHEFGTYHDLAIKYNDSYISELEDSNDPEKVELYNFFWNWVNAVESFDFETPEITEQCESKYYEMYPDRKCKVLHLKVA
jgi:hypothetical protein